MTTTTNERIDAIARRAIQLSSITSHGRACYLACDEFGVKPEDRENVASLVSQRVTEIQCGGY